jgi:hypothetical protein
MTSAPPKISPKLPSPGIWSSNSRFALVVLAVTGMGIAALVYFFNPSAYGFYPVCQFHRLTGLNCPGCGATRALYALLHGNFSTALRDNVLLAAGIPVMAVRGGWLALNRWRGRSNGDFFPARFLLPLLVVIIVFGVLRNLPAFAFLSPP